MYYLFPNIIFITVQNKLYFVHVFMNCFILDLQLLSKVHSIDQIKKIHHSGF